MPIQGLGGVYGQQGVIPGTRQLGGDREVESEGSRAPGEATNHPSTPVGSQGDLPVQAPPGTAEERSFFARAQTMGPLTYDRVSGNGAEAAMQRGSRLDVRV